MALTNVTGPEAQFCQMLETNYQMLRSTIDTVINTPEMSAKLIKSFAKRIVNVVMALIEQEIAYYEYLLHQFEQMILNSKLGKMTDRLCLDIHNCPKIVSLCENVELFGNQSDLSDFQTFKFYVCGGRLIDSLNAISANFFNALTAKLSDWQNQYDTAVSGYIDTLLEKYTYVLNKPILGKSFLQWLAELDDYAACAFGACDFANTVVNYKDDINNRLYIDAQTGAPVKSQFTKDIDSKWSELSFRMDRLQNSVTDYNDNRLTKIKKENIASPF